MKSVDVRCLTKGGEVLFLRCGGGGVSGGEIGGGKWWEVGKSRWLKRWCDGRYGDNDDGEGR